MNGFDVALGTVLVASDDLNRLDAIAAEVRLAGCGARTVTDAKQALRTTLAEELSVIVLDLGDDDFSGVEVVKHLKAIERTRSIPVLLVNRTPSAGDALLRAYDAGAADVFDASIGAEIIGRKVAVFARLVAERMGPASQSLRLLADVTDLLGRSLDVRTTAPLVADRIVPALSDWCLIDALETDGAVRQIGEAHADPERLDWVRDLRAHRVHAESTSQGIAHVRRTTRTQTLVAADHPERVAEWLAVDASQAELIRALGAGSCLLVPICSRERVLGVMSFVSSESRAAFGRATVALAEEIAHRVAVAMDHASLHDEARRATNACDQLLSAVTHDLRNPLSAVLTSAELLAQIAAVEGEGQGGKVHRAAEVIVESAERMDALTRRVLEFARVQSGRLALARRVVDARELLAKCVKPFEAVVKARNLRLSIAIGSTARVDCDEERIQQVFASLLENALEQSAPGSTVVVRAESLEDSVVFSVADTGEGRPRDQLAHFFDHAWNTRLGRRSGLGLALAKGVVEAHRGRMWVASEVGVGTTVYFALPRVTEESTRANVE